MQYIKLIGLTIVMVILLVTNMWWLAAIILGLIGLFFLLSKSVIKSPLLRYPLKFIYILIIAICLRVFGGELYAVPSASMTDTIMPGDKLIVSKLHYGPALPQSPYEIPLFNLLYFIATKGPHQLDSVWWEPNRLSGFNDFTRGDIMVFDPPFGKDAFVKRCVGLPGDTLRVDSSMVFIDGQVFKEPHTVRRWYQVADGEDVEIQLKEMGVYYRNPDSLNRAYRVLMSLKQKQILEEQLKRDAFQVRMVLTDTVPRAYPWNKTDTSLYWSADFFGPFIVPKKGMSILLDPYHFKLYSPLINRSEGLEDSLRFSEGEVFLGDSLVKNYTFRKNYLFMMGDHRYDSNDSRFWGPVPEERVIGKAVLVLFSWGRRDGFQLHRTFKPLF